MKIIKEMFIVFCVAVISVLLVSQFACANDSIIGFWKFNGDKVAEDSAAIYIGLGIEIGDTYVIYNSNNKEEYKTKTESNYTYFKGETSILEVEQVDGNSIIVTRNLMPVSFPFTRMNDEEAAAFKKAYDDTIEKEASINTNQERRQRMMQSF